MSGIGGHIECFESHMVPVKLGTAFREEICMTIQTSHNKRISFNEIGRRRYRFLENKHYLFSKFKASCYGNPPNGIRTPSGCHIAKTVIGPTMYGRGISKASETANKLDGLGIMPEETQGDEKVQRYFKEYSKLISFENNVITAHFPLKENLDKKNQKIAASGKSVYNCQYCDTGFNSIIGLSRHRTTKHADEYSPPTIPCPICGEGVRSHRELAEHAHQQHAENSDEFVVETVAFQNAQDYHVRVYDNLRKH
ncbi:hypothetical protein RB195_023643 [Necator americanus]|uniref:C2H2-type domain-containing protein n=1 Tax=Necator americanus TaxID=51031 RepID=A0ABR1EK46_NECAM